MPARRKDDYFEAGLGLLAKGGADAVTIAKLCARLRVTKGSFYHHFTGRADFVRRLLRYWERDYNGRLSALVLDVSDLRKRVVSMQKAALLQPEVDGAIRYLARSDPHAAAVQRRVERRREAALVRTFREMGMSAERASRLAGIGLAIAAVTQDLGRGVDRRRFAGLVGRRRRRVDRRRREPYTPRVAPDSRPYVVITADTHAGAAIDAYRDYLDAAERAEFDAWRGSYQNPSRKHVGGKKSKNWDSAERLADLGRDGVIGEVIFPNTVPPFYAQAFHISPPPRPERYARELAGIRAHNRWLADFCAEEPERRAGIGLIHLNDLDDAIADVKWIAENGLRGGVLLPLPSPSEHWLKPLNHPDYDRLWAVIQDCDLVINQHSGQGSPEYCEGQGSKALWASEMAFFVQRGFTHLIMGGVFERFPKLRYILTESGCSWAPTVMKHLDSMYLAWKAGAIGEIDTSKDPALKELPSFYARRNCWYGASFPGPRDVEGRNLVGVDKILWGNDYPHYEGCFPYSRENMRFAFSEVPEKEVRLMLGENAARLYGFDLEALRPAAEAAGITPELVARPLPVDEIPADSTCITFQRARFERARAAAR